MYNRTYTASGAGAVRAAGRSSARPPSCSVSQEPASVRPNTDFCTKPVWVAHSDSRGRGVGAQAQRERGSNDENFSSREKLSQTFATDQ